MNESKISVRYSRALFQSALERKILDKVSSDMTLIGELCKIPEVAEVLNSPIIIPTKKSRILHALFGSDVDPIVSSMIGLVVKNGRESFLPAIARVFVHETMKYNGITESILTTAVETDPGIRKQVSVLIEDLFKTKVDLRENVDPDIIGGFILKIDDNYIDASIRSKLNKIRKELRSKVISS